MRFLTLTQTTLAAACLLGLFTAPVHAQNIVNNPGFETGDFTDWTTTPAASGSLFGVGLEPHSGSYDAYFAASGATDDAISQVLPTIAGHNYTLDFWVKNTGGGNNDFTALIDATTELSIVNSFGFIYTEETATFLAAGNDTLTLEGRDHNSSFQLDDVSVTANASPNATPEPGSLALLFTSALSCTAFAARRRRTRKAV